MKTVIYLLSSVLLTCAGCANHRTAQQQKLRDDTVGRPGERSTYVGSNIPRGPNQYPIGPVSADVPRNSIYRKTGDLTPSEPVVKPRNQAPENDVDDSGHR